MYPCALCRHEVETVASFTAPSGEEIDLCLECLLEMATQLQLIEAGGFGPAQYDLFAEEEEDDDGREG